MELRVPVLGTEHDTAVHRLDSRVKLVLFALLVGYLYAAPTWPWLAGMAVVGLVLGILARVPPLWLAVLWLAQIPNIIGFFVVPVVGELLSAGPVDLGNEIAFGLRLVSAWAAALFVSVTLFSTIRVNELTDGMRGLKIPEIVCFAFGYAFLLLYTSLNDILRIGDAMRIKGVTFSPKHPIDLVRNLLRLFIPALFTTVRRASTLMAVLQLRGFSFTERRQRVTPVKFDIGDAVALLLGLAALAAVLAARFGLLPFGT